MLGEVEMRLVIRLILRLVGVALACLAVAVVWSMVDAHRSIETETSATADRVGKQLQVIYWQELLWRGGTARDSLLPTPEWRTLSTLALISPGVCVDFNLANDVPRRLCGQVVGVGVDAPSWFVSIYDKALGPHRIVDRTLSEHQRDAGTIQVSAAPEAAVRIAWGRVSILVGLAAALAAAISLFSALAVAQALAPAQKIIAGLRRLSVGDYQVRVVSSIRGREFAPIAAAVNDLAHRLMQAANERLALTRKLIQTREDERRDLARELHDEFGQCLTAMASLAGAIQIGAEVERPELVEDAREIERLAGRLSGTLRGTLERLHNPVAQEIGLEASLIELVAGYNTRATNSVAIHLDVEGDLASVPASVASGVYRVAQESLTNAMRHGDPNEVRLRVTRISDQNESIVLMVEDDGGGDATRIAAAPGRGISGMQERIRALGGQLSILGGARGICIAAVIPTMLPA
jgi:two-component system sensor histidine kinase UhpB